VPRRKQRRTHFAQRCDQVTLDNETPTAELAQRYDHLLGHGDERGSEVKSKDRARSEEQSKAGLLHLAPSQDPASREEILPPEIMITALTGKSSPERGRMAV
jgi:hypothetical protein